jgi:hypothetical protein
MHRKTLLASALAVLLAGSASLVMAQNTPSPAATSAPASSMDTAAKHFGGHHDRDMRHHGFSGQRNGQRGGVMGDLRGLERLYMESGRSKDLAALYNDVLAKSQDPRVRDYVYRHLARLQARPANVDQAIATLRKGLDESLANEAKMRAERERMRATWQQQRGATTPPAAAQ